MHKAYYADFAKKIEAFVLFEGGQFTREFSEDISIAIVNKVGQETKRIEKLVKEGKRIDVLGTKGRSAGSLAEELLGYFLPSTETTIAMLRAGQIERLSKYQLLACTLVEGPFELKGSDLSDLKLSNCFFDWTYDNPCPLRLGLNHCKFSNADLSFCSFIEVEESAFTKAKLTSIRKTSFKDCDFANSTWHGFSFDLSFSNCNFTGASLKDAALLHSNLKGADLSGVDFSNSRLMFSNLSNAKIDGANFTGCNLFGANLDGVRGTAIGLEQARKEQTRDLPAEAERFVNCAMKADSYSITAVLKKADHTSVLRVFPAAATIVVEHRTVRRTLLCLSEPEPVNSQNQSFHPTECDLEVPTIPRALEFLSSVYSGYSIELNSFETTIRKGGPDAKEFPYLALSTFCRMLKLPVPSQSEYKASLESEKQSLAREKESLNLMLKQGNIADFNRVRLESKIKHSFKSADFAALKIDGADFSGADLQSSNLATCVMTNCQLQKTNMRAACLRESILNGADLRGATAEEAIFDSSSACGVRFDTAILTAARFCMADLTGSSFQDADIRGADFTNAKLVDVNFAGAKYDGTTKIDHSKLGAAPLAWCGKGPEPCKLNAVQESVSSPQSFKEFFCLLEQNIDSERLKKAIKMLRSESFQLYAEVEDNRLFSIVKSQNNEDLLYSCILTDTGNFSCGTQNSNSCGGLRGSLCKHLLVLIMGLVQTDQLKASVADVWVRKSVHQKPVLDKENLTETFLRYWASKVGEVDWRPTETIPEDYIF